MRKANTYRGARRNMMRRLRLLSRQVRDRRFEILEAAARQAGGR